jgi:hypothetical protein
MRDTFHLVNLETGELLGKFDDIEEAFREQILPENYYYLTYIELHTSQGRFRIKDVFYNMFEEMKNKDRRI